LALILDTNGLSAMAEGDPGVALFLQQATEIMLPVIALGEYRYGIRQSRRGARYEQWLIEVLGCCRVLVVDETTATVYADIRSELRRAGRPIPENDIWIAALARQHSLPLLSRDQHFDLVAGVQRIGW
jgi:tRNA(fMet)-specific endonuclease VapC